MKNIKKTHIRPEQRHFCHLCHFQMLRRFVTCHSSLITLSVHCHYSSPSVSLITVLGWSPFNIFTFLWRTITLLFLWSYDFVLSNLILLSSVHIYLHISVYKELEEILEHINQLNKDNFKIFYVLFKVIISSYLPLLWDTFTESYVGGHKGITETDLKKLMGSQQFIGILKEEYLQRQLRSHKGEIINQINYLKRSLENWITAGPSASSGLLCKHCGKDNHHTLNCKYLGDGKCSICRKFGHASDRCWERNKEK